MPFRPQKNNDSQGIQRENVLTAKQASFRSKSIPYHFAVKFGNYCSTVKSRCSSPCQCHCLISASVTSLAQLMEGAKLRTKAPIDPNFLIRKGPPGLQPQKGPLICFQLVCNLSNFLYLRCQQDLKAWIT